jgi:hypothetical protein
MDVKDMIKSEMFKSPHVLYGAIGHILRIVPN